jgi:hypothetical protein
LARRLVLSFALTAGLLIGSFPLTASAHGPKLRGVEIDRSGVITATTGNCNCNWQYYTLGLRAGPIRIDVKLSRVHGAFAPAFGARLFLSQATDGNAVAHTQVGCMAKQTNCGAMMRLETRISHPGVYYILVSGDGALKIPFTMSVRGRVYPLHCGSYC